MTTTGRSVLLGGLAALAAGTWLWVAYGARNAEATKNSEGVDGDVGLDVLVASEQVAARDPAKGGDRDARASTGAELERQTRQVAECDEAGWKFPCGRDPIYRQAGFGDPSNPYYYASTETLRALAEAGDGAAHWHLANRLSVVDLGEARFHALAASALLTSAEPMLSFVENHLSHEEAVLQAIPYLVLAEELGGPNDRTRYYLGKASPEEIDSFDDEVAELRKTVVRLWLSVPADGG